MRRFRAAATQSRRPYRRGRRRPHATPINVAGIPVRYPAIRPSSSCHADPDSLGRASWDGLLSGAPFEPRPELRNAPNRVLGARDGSGFGGTTTFAFGTAVTERLILGLGRADLWPGSGGRPCRGRERHEHCATLARLRTGCGLRPADDAARHLTPARQMWKSIPHDEINFQNGSDAWRRPPLHMEWRISRHAASTENLPQRPRLTGPSIPDVLNHDRVTMNIVLRANLVFSCGDGLPRRRPFA